MRNLWNLKDIESKIKSSPNLILEEQAKYFEKNVHDILYAKINNAKLNELKNSTYKLATSFSVVSPVLDNYTYVLFTVYSNPECNYPVLIEVNDDEWEDSEYECKNEQEFIESLTKILGSENTTEIISVLYSKSKNY